MRRPYLFCLILCFSLFGSFGAKAEQDVLIDRLAADFYENSLRPSQSRNIEAASAEIYRGLNDAARAEFRAERRSRWRSLAPDARQSLRSVKTPDFENLTEAQKAPFRRAAAAMLGAETDHNREIGHESEI